LNQHDLPQLAGRIFLTDGGIETTLMFIDGFELQQFACYPLLRSERGREALQRYYDSYLAIAASDGRGIVLQAPTWRASSHWGDLLGHSVSDLAELNRDGVAMVRMATAKTQDKGAPAAVVSGCVGPAGDGYVASGAMTSDAARRYHAPQIDVLADEGVEMVSALTMNYVEEALGVALAARDAAIPVGLSFTVETDGRLPTGMRLRDAIAAVDELTEGYPTYYGINCAHPSHFIDELAPGEAWLSRVGEIRANASALSHAELDEAPDLDRGDIPALAADYVRLSGVLPRLAVVGGCCGTDAEHIAAISTALYSSS